MADIKTNQSKVYNALKGMGFSGIGANEAEFAAKMSNPKNREKVYNALSSKGYKGIGKDQAAFDTLIYQAQQPDQHTVRQATETAPKDTARVDTTPTMPNPQQPENVAQTMQNPTPMQFPQGFGELDVNQANQDMLRRMRGENTWVQQGDVNPTTENVEQKQNTNQAKQLKKALKGDKQAAKESGLDTAVQRMQDELDYSNATGKALGEGQRYAQWEAPTVARDENGQMMVGENGQPLTGMSTDEQRAAQYQQQQREITRKQLIDPLVDDVINKIRNEGKVSPEGLLAPGEAQLYLRERNKATSPEAIMKALDEYFGTGNKEDNTPEGESRVLAHWDDKEDFTTRFLLENQDAIRESAARVGMNTDDYVMQELIPQLSNTIAERFGQQMGKEYSVKGAADYFMKRMLDSGVGALVRMGNGTTPMQSQYMTEELEKSNQGEGRDFNADWYHKFGGMVAQFLPDTPLMMMGGAAGGAAAKGLGSAISSLGAEGLGTMVATGSPFLAANVGKLTKWGGLLGHAVTSGAANMGTFMGTSSMLQAMASTPVDEGYLSSIGLAGWEGAKEGAKIGTALGVLGTASGAGKGLWNTAAGRAAWAGGSFLAENQIFALSDYLADPEKFNWVDSSLDALYMQLAGKVQGLSTHGAEGIKQSWKHIFEPMPKMPTLTDAEKETVRKAFGGMSFEQIAGDMSNLEKILSDKENIPLTIRQKISGRTLGVFEPNRPRTYKFNIRGNEIYERAKDGELLDIHRFETPEEQDAIIQDIADRKQHDQMVHDFISLDMQEKSAPILDGFAQEYGMTRQDVWDMMQKKPVELREDELDLMDELSRRLHEAANPKGELHTEQSNTDGAELAGSESAMNPESAAQLSQEVDEARNAYLSAPVSEDVQQAINSLGKDARLDDIYMNIRANFSGHEVDNFLAKLADYANALAKRDGFIAKTGDNIDEAVSRDIDEKSFHGTIDDAIDEDNIITINKDGVDYVLLNGYIGTRDGVTIDPDKSGSLIIAKDVNGNWVQFKPDALMTISSRESKEDYGNRVREGLQVQDTQTAIETGLVQTEAESRASVPETSETGTQETESIPQTEGSDTQQSEPQQQVQIPIDEKSGLKRYEQGVPEEQAIQDIQNDGFDVNEMADAYIAEAQETVNKINKKEAKKPQDLIERKRQQGIIDYYDNVKKRFAEINKSETKLNGEPKENNEPENVVTLQPKAASEQQEEQKKPSLKSRIQQLAERYKKKFGEYFNDDIDVPGDATELVALNIGTGRQFQWDDKPDGKRGFKTALGVNTEFGGRRGSEGHAFAHLFKGKDDTSGLGFDEFVDKVWRSDENTIHGLDGSDTKRFTEQQIGDAVIDLFLSAEQGKDITEYVIRNRVEKAQKGWTAEQERLKEEAERNEKVELTDEDLERIKNGLPFEMPTDEDIPDSPITRLMKEVDALQKEDGVPSITLVNSDRVSRRQWRELAEHYYDGAFFGDEEVENFRKEVVENGVFYNPETGKITVFSGELTPEELRTRINIIKERIKDGLSENEENGETRDSLERVQEGEGGRGGSEAVDDRQGEGRPESESSERDEYLKPRNEKEQKIVSDVEAKLAEEIKAAEEDVRKAKSELKKAETNESYKATDMFANDKVFEEKDQIFSSEEMGLDTSAKGVEKRTKAERDTVSAAEQKLERLKSKAEHDSRVRGALDNERRQTSIDEIDNRHKEKYDKYIKPLLDRSDEELEQLAKEKENAVGGDLKKLEGDKEYSAIKIVQVQREVDRQNESVRKHKEKVNSRENLEKKKANLTERLEETEAILKEHSKDQKAQESADRLRERIEEIDEKLKSLDSNPIDTIEKAAQVFNEERKQEQKELGITTDETPEQKADRERAEKLADTPLTDSEVDSSSASDVQKTLAKAYLNGNHGLLQEAAYLNVYNDVRNRRQDNAGDRSDANRTQLAGPDGIEERGSGQPGEPTGDMAPERDVPRQDVAGSQTEGVQRPEDSKNDVRISSGKGSDSGVPESESKVDGLSSGSGQPVGGSGTGSERRDVRSSGADQRGSGMVGQTGERKAETRRDNAQKPAAGSDAAIAASKQRLAELRKKFKDAGHNGTLSVSLVGMNSEQIGVLGEIITESANLGYQYISRGMRDFNEWRKQMLSDFKDWLQEDFKWTDSDVEEYLREVWNCEYNIDGVTRTIGEWASFIGENELKKVVKSDRGTKFDQQKAAESVETKVGDIDNIRESLPFLLPEQQDDVYKAETQFFSEEHQDRAHGNGKGMMFTNGTGTGKTYTGLGIVKRFVKQGKGRVLILTPSQEKVGDWRRDGLNLGLDIESLDEEAKMKGTSATKAKGKGVVVTTYANARQNLAMLEDCFDLIVYDESHKIMESKEATNTTMMDFHEMLTNKNVERSMDRQTYWLPEWVEHRNLLKEREENRERLDALNNYDDNETVKVDGKDVVVAELKANLNARMKEIENRLEELRPIMQEIRESKRPQAEIDSKRTKTVFLSATPFNVRESLRYAEGYLFSYPEEDKNTIGSYNHRSPEDAFLEQMFPAGYRWRYGRLESHVSNAEALGRQEIDFSDYLQNTLQTMSGRMISSDYDYSRDFPVLTLDHAGRFNQAMSEVYRNRRYQPLAEAFRKSFDYNYSTALFEAMKTSLVNDRINEHLNRGQKVVVFHRRRTSGELEPPFRRALEAARVQASMEQDENTKTKILTAIKAFEEDFADMLEWEKTIDYSLPREQIEKRFGKDKVAFFSGAETKKTKHQSVEDFMKDNGGKDIIVIQEASGKEGISLHDQTGEHQRVEINLALPQSPIAFIQIEGRIYRIGQKSNAIFEYPLLGLDLETNLFAQKFNGALGTTENLALGSKARNLRKSIANSVLENTGEVDYERQGLGGKDMDGRVNEAGDKDGFDVSIQDYYGNQKMQRGRDNREGVDYFPTPEPVGYKMVEWGQMMDGETALEPSAGHGAIARYVPETNGMTAIEPSASLFTKLQMRAGGPGRRFEEMTFEDYPLANKHDVVLMNPPYGVGGKTAMEHVAKAFRHLNEGGRVIAIIPDGPAMDKRLDAWLSSSGSEGLNGAAVVVGEVKLPSVAFGRAGTNVRTRVVVIDKVTRAQMREKMPRKVEVDLSNEESIGGLFDRIRNVRMPERTIDQVAINEKRAKRTEKQFDDNPFVSSIYIGQDYSRNSVMRVSTKGSTTLDMDFNLAKISEEDALKKYEELKKYRDNPEKLDFGRWITRSFGSGKNRVPALDAIRDYCDTAIKTLENITRMTADQMDKAVRTMKEEAERRRVEQEAEMDRLREERKRQQEEKLKPIIETALAENSDNPSLSPAGIELNIKIANGNIYHMAEKSKRILENAGIDWQTGHKINKNEPVNARTSTVVSQQPTQRKADYEYKLDKNTRTGEDMHLVNYGGARLSDADYRAIERKAKANDGYYNRFKKAWHFKTEEDARKFMESVNASEGNDGSPTTRFRFAKDKEEFDKIREDAVRSKGLVVKGLNDADISITHVDNHEFGDKPIDKARDWANKNLVTSEEDIKNNKLPKMKDGTPYVISKKAIGKYLSEDGMASSDNKDVHLSVLKRLKDVISESIEAEVHPDYPKIDGVRTTEKYNDNALIHRLYGAVEIDGKVYRVKTTMQEFRGSEANKPHSYEVTKIELLDSPMTASESPSVNVGQHKTDTKESTNNSISGAKLLKDVEKSYDSGKKLLDESEKSTFFRKGEASQTPLESDFRRKEEAGRKLAKKLNSDFEALTSVDQIQNKEVRDAIAAGHEVPGWIEIGKDGKKKIFMYLPHVRDTYDAEKTIAHETIGHQGLRELLGEKGYKSYCRALLYDLKDPELQKYWMENLAKNGFDTYRTIDEFLAEAAEKGYGDLGMWQKVKNAMTDALRSAGFTMSPSIADVKYMVWLSKHNLEKGNVINRIEREALLYRLGKERYEAKVRNGEFTEEQKALEGGNDVPYFPGEGKTLFRHTPSVKNQRRNYERALKRAGYVWKEAHVDAMQSAIELMRAISGHKKIEEIPSAENFVLLENQMSSKEEQMDFLFNRDYMKPLDDAVSRCLPDMGKGIDEQLKNLQLYMIKKHGLERNRVLYVRDAIRDLRKDSSADQQQVDDMEKDYNDTMRDLRDDLRNGTIDLKEYFEEVDKWISNNIPEYKAGEKDYSGLTDLYGKGYNEADIIDEVMSTEAMLGDERVNNLWEKTNAVSKFGLDMEYEGGLDSKEKHDKVSDMFEWYVPLRGYDEKTAEEVYDYLEEHGNDRKWAGPVLMNAKGRESLADVDVFATLGAMSSSAINRSLHNQMKQAFARFVRNHYNEVDASDRLVTELPHVWAEKQHDPVTGADVWVEKFPDIPENAKADDVAAILDQYQQDMKAKEATGDAKRVRQNSNIPFRPAKAEHKAQHIVDVWINGEKHSFVVNGNPRAAQAINGQLKAERNSNILWLSSLSHFMAKMNTSYSPDFIMRNTERDLIYSAANIAVKENFEYWLKWAKNYGVATGRVAAGVPGMHTNLFKRYREGNLNMANPTDRYFKEFMENGGETGWVERKNLDKWKKAIKEGVKKDSKPEQVGKAVINALPDAIEAMNERAENMARFATYMTSREMGRTITRSVSDAKEVSVNFNRKGAGKKTVGLNKGDNSWLRNANAYMAGWSAQNLQDYIMFYNAGVQGMTNMIKNVANHPIKGSTAFAAFALAGMLMPRLNQFLFNEDDDKTGKEPENPYAELPEYVRRNNLCIYSDKGNFITIALPIELRAMYGIGDMAASYINRPELRSTKNMGEDIVTQLSQIAPLDFFGEGAGPMWAVVPSGVRPFAEAAANKNWLGQPIERNEERWNQNKPRWTRAFKNVGDAYVGASKRLNAATNPYNDENIKGWADGAITDPALVEHIVNGYFGGVGSTVNRVAQLAKHADEMSPKEAITSNWMPIVRTQHYSPNERTRYARTRNKWWYYKEEADKTNETIKVLKARGEHDPISFMQSISEEEGKKGSRAKVMEKAYKRYSKIKKKLEKTDDLQQKDLYQLQMDQIMEGAVKELDKIQ